MEEYRHTQTGYLLLVSYGVLTLFAGFFVFVTGFSPVFMVALLLLVIALCIFAGMTVVVGYHSITIEFYLGFPRKVISLDSVVAQRVVRCPWYYGWGIRYTPGAWLYRVSGLAAVEIELSDGKRYRIGSDEPEELAEAIAASTPGGTAKGPRR